MTISSDGDNEAIVINYLINGFVLGGCYIGSRKYVKRKAVQISHAVFIGKASCKPINEVST